MACQPLPLAQRTFLGIRDHQSLVAMSTDLATDLADGGMPVPTAAPEVVTLRELGSGMDPKMFQSPGVEAGRKSSLT